MSKKKAFNEGAKMGIRLSEEIVSRNTDAMEFISKQVDSLSPEFEKIKEVYSTLRDDLENIQVKELFGVVRTFDYKEELEQEEKILVLKLLSYITNKFDSSEAQKQYFSRLCVFLEVNPNDTICTEFDEVCISNIDSKKVTKALYLLVKEFLFLESNSHDYGDKYAEVLGWFGKDISDSDSEALINIKVKTFGVNFLYEQFGAEVEEIIENANGKPCYIDIPETTYCEISKECAQVFFDFNESKQKDSNKVFFNLNKSEKTYCESSSYIIYTENDTIVYYDKETVEKQVLLENIKDADSMFSRKSITTFQDFAFYFVDNKLFCCDLKSNDKLFIKDIKLPKDENSRQCTIENISYLNNKIIYGTDKLYILDLKTLEEKEIIGFDKKPLYAYKKYVIKDKYIFFVDDYWDIEYKEVLTHARTGFVLYKYNIENGITTTASEPFCREKKTELSIDLGNDKFYDDIFIHNDNVIVSIGWEAFVQNVKQNLYCRFDISKDNCCSSKIDISKEYISQVVGYKQKIVYIDCQKDFSLTVFDFVTNKKKIIAKNLGYTKKQSILDKIVLGKDVTPQKYLHLGKWICYFEQKNKIIINLDEC